MVNETIKLLSGKLHRVTVTACHLDYVGSIKVDQLLLQAANILPLEYVEVVNLNNGNRWHTYVLPGEPGKGEICPNGGGAYLAKPQDILIIWSHVDKSRHDVMMMGHSATVAFVNEQNKLTSRLTQRLFFDEKGEVHLIEEGVPSIT